MRVVSVLLALLAVASVASADPINLVSYASVGPNVVDFSDVASAGFPGVNYNGILVSGGVSFAERFVGQTLSFSGDLDVLSGTPTGPLALQTGAAGQNLSVGTDGGVVGLYPYGNLGFPAANGYGEGSWAALFPGLVSEVAFEAYFGSGPTSSVTVQFFNSSGGLIDSKTVPLTIDSFLAGSFGFSREGGVKDIAGFSVHTSDPGGLAYDNVRFDDPSTSGPSQPVPEPASLALLAAVAGIAALRRRQR
jgi:hypothetical protein